MIEFLLSKRYKGKCEIYEKTGNNFVRELLYLDSEKKNNLF